jgi:hypothetical protein
MSAERPVVSKGVRWFAGVTLGSLFALICWAVASSPTSELVHASALPVSQQGLAIAAAPAPPAAQGTGLALERFDKLTKRCKKASVTEDSVQDQPRFMCSVSSPTSYLFEAIGDRANLHKITVMVPMGGNMSQLLKQLMAGVQFFQDVAGRKVGEIAPDEWLKQVATQPTHFEYQGLSYDTMAVPSVGILYTISKS